MFIEKWANVGFSALNFTARVTGGKQNPFQSVCQASERLRVWSHASGIFLRTHLASVVDNWAPNRKSNTRSKHNALTFWLTCIDAAWLTLLITQLHMLKVWCKPQTQSILHTRKAFNTYGTPLQFQLFMVEQFQSEAAGLLWTCDVADSFHSRTDLHNIMYNTGSLNIQNVLWFNNLLNCLERQHWCTQALCLIPRHITQHTS